MESQTGTTCEWSRRGHGAVHSLFFWGCLQPPLNVWYVILLPPFPTANFTSLTLSLFLLALGEASGRT